MLQPSGAAECRGDERGTNAVHNSQALPTCIIVLQGHPKNNTGQVTDSAGE